MADPVPRTSKARYKRELPRLRDRLLDAQFALHAKPDRAVAIILTGVPAAGRSECVAELLEWLDPKFIDVHAYAPATEDRPVLWRYWQDLPAKGRIGIFFGAWYEEWMRTRCRKASRKVAADRRIIARIRQLEAMLILNGVQVLKIHLDVPPDIQKKRLRKLSGSPLTRWRVTREDRWLAAHSKRVNAVFAKAMKATTTAAAPWHRIDGSDAEYRFLAFGTRVLEALRKAAGSHAVGKAQPMPRPVKVAALSVERAAVSLPDEEYEETLLQLQGRLARLARKRRFLERGAVLAFEGMDAAGKGGAIRHLVRALDVRQYRIVPVSAPSPEERRYPYLWRFWKPVPERGAFTIYDRSWYGRVLVERVRGFATAGEWSRAFAEINEFEQQLVEHGIVLCKFWLDVSPKVQLQRFHERDSNELKRFKVDPEDWVNRRHFAAYQLAASEMVRKTSTSDAPWTLVDGDDKHFARLAVLSTVARTIEEAID